MRVCLVALLCVAACGDDSAPPIPEGDAGFNDGPLRPVGLDRPCDAAPCMTGLVCGSTVTAMICLQPCETQATCPEGRQCVDLPEARACTPTAEVPPLIVDPSYDVANLHGEVVGLELNQIEELIDVVVAAEEDLQLLNTGAEKGEERPNIRYEVLTQPGLPDGEDDKVSVYVMRSLTVEAGGRVTLGGSRPIILVVTGPVYIAGTISAPELGGVAGGAQGVRLAGGGPGAGPGGGLFEMTQGGGGASHCSNGGIGGGMTLEPPLAPVYGDASCQPLQGGSSGAGTGEPSGGGGPALQISAGSIEIATTGVIDVSGFDDARALEGAGPAGGGGGSGGALLMQAEEISIGGTISVDGGRGGTGAIDGTGGAGATGSEPAMNGNADGGGGGGLGRLRMESRMGAMIAPGAIISPDVANACRSESGLLAPVEPAAPPATCAYPAEPEMFSERCDLCHRRFCCGALTACEEDTTCHDCRVAEMPGPACDDVPLLSGFTSCINQFCFDACLGLRTGVRDSG